MANKEPIEIVRQSLIQQLAQVTAERDTLRDVIDRACNALTDSICVGGNDAGTNMSWVRKLRKFIKESKHG